MEIVSKILVLLVAVEHLYILALEMFWWTKPSTRKTFGTSEEFAQSSKALAANQGLYNGFLSAGLLWGLLHNNSSFGLQIQVFFLTCILVAAIFGGFTAKKSILIVQGIPALLALTSLTLY